MLFDWLTRDGKLFLAAKIVRTFAYGFLSVILAIYLKLIGFNKLLVGLTLIALRRTFERRFHINAVMTVSRH